MTPQKAIKYIEQHGHIADDVKDMCIKALEKQIPKKPKSRKVEYYIDSGKCPTCKKAVNPMSDEYFCSNKDCGQALMKKKHLQYMKL